MVTGEKRAVILHPTSVQNPVDMSLLPERPYQLLRRPTDTWRSRTRTALRTLIHVANLLHISTAEALPLAEFNSANLQWVTVSPYLAQRKVAPELDSAGSG